MVIILRSIFGLIIFGFYVITQNFINSKWAGGIPSLIFFIFFSITLYITTFKKRNNYKCKIFKTHLSSFLYAFLLFIISYITLVSDFIGITLLRHSSIDHDGFNPLYMSSLSTIISIFSMVFIEELIFRYYIIDFLNPKISLIISSVLFALIHGFNYCFIILIIIFIISILLGIYYLITKSILITISIHLAINIFVDNANEGNTEAIIVCKMDDIIKNNSSILSLMIFLIIILVLYHKFFRKYQIKNTF